MAVLACEAICWRRGSRSSIVSASRRRSRHDPHPRAKLPTAASSTSSARRRSSPANLFLDVLRHYHAAMLSRARSAARRRGGYRSPDPRPSRLGREQPTRGALSVRDFAQRSGARIVRGAQRAQNTRLAEGIARWRAPLVARGELLPMTRVMFVSQIIGPAQVFCRALSRPRPRAIRAIEADTLIACAIRAVVAPVRATATGETS